MWVPRKAFDLLPRGLDSYDSSSRKVPKTSMSSSGRIAVLGVNGPNQRDLTLRSSQPDPLTDSQEKGEGMYPETEEVKTTHPGSLSRIRRPRKWWVIPTAAVALHSRFASCLASGDESKNPVTMYL